MLQNDGGVMDEWMSQAPRQSLIKKTTQTTAAVVEVAA
jgi:hypothetical protein